MQSLVTKKLYLLKYKVQKEPDYPITEILRRTLQHVYLEHLCKLYFSIYIYLQQHIRRNQDTQVLLKLFLKCFSVLFVTIFFKSYYTVQTICATQ